MFFRMTREHAPASVKAMDPIPTIHQDIRLMTYNIHHGVGIDGRYKLSRIRRIIAEQAPDIVTLQEVDCGVPRSRGDDQTRQLAEALNMHCLHCVTHKVKGGDYGIAVLSRFPLLTNHRYDLTHKRREPRWCMRVDVEAAPGSMLHIFNVHLGLLVGERRFQRSRMLSEAILLAKDLHHPVVLMGDFNDRPVPVVHREMSRFFSDVFTALGQHCGPTFHWGPIRWRLDHVYTSPGLAVRQAQVINSPQTRLASDHRPILAVIRPPVLPALAL